MYTPVVSHAMQWGFMNTPEVSYKTDRSKFSNGTMLSGIRLGHRFEYPVEALIFQDSSLQ